jgi:hypothetical protein
MQISSGKSIRGNHNIKLTCAFAGRIYSARAQTFILKKQVNALPEMLPHPLPPPRCAKRNGEGE